ncbi:rhomboid family intramembrane serine protease [Tropicibacter sp. Alg240-R139]|uniref:rhomboid family intramembrane serine protease n=1 Tax=Tropicibacter sp. Alg240-R139 TaxID=2305991 RepID=UPI0013DF8CAE|nr:rhomboid family intramembrane serine protease [Tropicibacter sp. Alg240-R139]
MLTRLPFTLLFLAVMIVANSLAGTLSGVLSESALTNWGISHLSIRQGEVYRLISGTFFSHDLGMFLRQVVFAATVIGAYEWTQGSRRAVLLYVSIDVIGTLVVIFAILPGLVLLHPTIDSEVYADFDVGMSAGGFGLIGALIALLKYRWTCLFVVCVAIAVKIWVSFDAIADSAHLLCLFLGFAAQTALNSYARKPNVAQL